MTAGASTSKMRLAATLFAAHQDAPVIEYQTCCTASVKANAEDFRVYFLSEFAGRSETFFRGKG
jgi:hypothetical protein